MTIHVLGSGGMLGKALQRQNIGVMTLLPHLVADITDPAALYAALRNHAAPGDVIINAAGILPGGDEHDMIRVNALGPFVVAGVAETLKARVLHVSTDCVWSGDNGLARRTVTTPTNPADLYGQTKVIGEVNRAHVLNVRTSFIGPDHGFLRWVIENREAATLPGWFEALWSGSTVDEVARHLISIANGLGVDSLGKPDRRLALLSAQPHTSKGHLLEWILHTVESQAKVTREFKPIHHRAMQPTYTMRSVFECLKDTEAWYLNEERWSQ